MMAITVDITRKNVAIVPTTRLAWARSRRPIAWPIRIVAARPTPNTAASSRKRTLFAFVVAAIPRSPIRLPTQ